MTRLFFSQNAMTTINTLLVVFQGERYKVGAKNFNRMFALTSNEPGENRIPVYFKHWKSGMSSVSVRRYVDAKLIKAH